MENLPIERRYKLTKRYSLEWGPGASIGIAVLAYIVSQIIISLPLVLMHVDVEDNTSLIGQPWFSLVLSGISAVGIFVVLWVFLKARKTSFKSLGFRRLRLKDFGWLALAVFVYFISLAVAISLVSLIPGFDAEQNQDLGGFSAATGWQIALSFVGLVVLPPLAEEMLFRGFMYRGLASKWPKILSAFITSALFALVHFQWNVGVDVFVLSLVLIALYEKTKNLWMCVFLHAIKNFIAFMAIFAFAANH